MNNEVFTALNRRKFMSRLAGVSVIPALGIPGGRIARADGEPHFFLHLCVSGGVDATYTFDARPLAFTDAGKLSNYCYRNANEGFPTLYDPAPLRHEGSNGGTTLLSPLTESLSPYLSELTIVNGVLMSTLNNGHGGNMYHLFSNSVGPAESFVPKIGGTSLPLESIHMGGWEGDGNRPPTNFDGSVQLPMGAGSGLTEAVVGSRHFPLASGATNWAQGAMERLGQGNGSFSRGARSLGNSFAQGPGLAAALTSAGGGNATGDLLADGLATTMAYFKGGVTRAATLMIDYDPAIDVHDAGTAQSQVGLYTEILQRLSTIFATLQEPYNAAEGLTWLDVTTVMISSEFSRTMRSLTSDDLPVDATGTDHNPLTNTFLFAGKGIKKGQVIGASDLDTLDSSGEFANVSGAHVGLDPALKCFFAKPFDFDTSRPRTDLPVSFDGLDYLNVSSLTNTMMSLFEVPDREWFRIGGSTAPILNTLLDRG